MSFNNLGLSAPLLKSISKQGYITPSPIQQKAIPVVLQGKDLLASAQTGTGKTAGFALPMLQLLSKNVPAKRRQVRALILAPTRELAAQVFDDIKNYGEFLDLRSSVIFGGVNQNPQVNALRNGVDILVATPGRLLDLHNQRFLFLDNVEILVLDEADRMLDMGFLRDIKKIIGLMPKKRQNLLFSATFSQEIKKLANGLLHHPVAVEATPENTTAEKVDQLVYRVDKKMKPEAMIQLIFDGQWQQALVFTRTKHGANRLSEKLRKNDITSAAIHGNKSQGARTKALADFKKGSIRVLVATDIAARGLDIPLLPHVVNYELPNVPEDYVHRIGRTGRAGASGLAISLVSVDEMEYVQGIEKLLKVKLPTQILEGFEPTEKLADVLKDKKERDSAKRSRHSRPSGNSRRNGGRKNNFRR